MSLQTYEFETNFEKRLEKILLGKSQHNDNFFFQQEDAQSDSDNPSNSIMGNLIPLSPISLFVFEIGI